MVTKDILLVRILDARAELDKKTVVQWGAFSRNGEVRGDTHIAKLDELKQHWYRLQTQNEQDEEVMPARVILLLSGDLTIDRLHYLNSGQRKHINTALPYMIEESLAQDVDGIHIASYLHRKDNVVSVVAIPHDVLQHILSLFDEVAFSPDRIYSECQLLQPASETASLVLNDKSVMMATPLHATLTLDYDAVPLALSQRVESRQEDSIGAEVDVSGRISQVRLIYPSGFLASSNEKAESLKVWLNAEGWLCQEQILDSSFFEYLAEQYFQRQNITGLIDLRQGPYRSAQRASRKIARWRPVIGLAICWLVIEFSITIGQGVYFGNQATELWDQNADLYLSIFPQDRQVRDVKARHQRAFNLQTWLENRLKQSGKTMNHDNVFLPLLQQLSLVTAEQRDEAVIIPKGIDFSSESGRLTFEFMASSLDIVNKLESDLKAKGLQARLDSANQEKSGVIARMTVAR